MPRHRRRKALSEVEIKELERIAARLHADLTPLLIALSPVSPQYQAIQRLHQAMLDTVKDVTGQEAEWCRIGPGRMSNSRNGENG